MSGIAGAWAAETGLLEVPIQEMPSKVEDVLDRLLTALAVGEYLPGAQLPDERTIAANLKVSRATVREALSSLTRFGLVQKRRGRGGGTFVTEARWADMAPAVARSLESRWEGILEALDAVGRLQEAIARAAAENRTADDIVDLERALAAFRSAQSGRARQSADSALHLAICAAAHNRTFVELLVNLEQRISIAGPVHLWGQPEDHAGMEAQALADHEALVRHIAAGDAGKAGALAREHSRIDLMLLESARNRAMAAAGTSGH